MGLFDIDPDSIRDFAAWIRRQAERFEGTDRMPEETQCDLCTKKFRSCDDGALVRHYRGFCAQDRFNALNGEVGDLKRTLEAVKEAINLESGMDALAAAKLLRAGYDQVKKNHAAEIEEAVNKAVLEQQALCDRHQREARESAQKAERAREEAQRSEASMRTEFTELKKTLAQAQQHAKMFAAAADSEKKDREGMRRLLDEAREELRRNPAGGDLTFEQIEQACKNIGYDLTCGACAAVFYTGFGAGTHTCKEKRDECFWVPEHPRLPLYRAAKPLAVGKLGQSLDLLTASIHDAMRFDTQEACQRWINENPRPRFVPREHGIMKPATDVVVEEEHVCKNCGLVSNRVHIPGDCDGH